MKEKIEVEVINIIDDEGFYEKGEAYVDVRTSCNIKPTKKDCLFRFSCIRPTKHDIPMQNYAS